MTDQPAPNKKKRVNSKSKGNGFENKIAKLLSEKLAPLTFVRSQGSGARVGGKNFETMGKMFGEDALKLFVGDIVPTNERDVDLDFRFSIECKFYKTAERMESLLTGSSLIYGWMNEALNDAQKINRAGLVIFKFNNTKCYVAVDRFMQLPVNNKITILNGIQVCLLDDLLEQTHFWTRGKQVQI